MKRMSCPHRLIDFNSEEDYRKAVNKFLKGVEGRGWVIESYPDATGYFYVEKKKEDAG